MQQLKNLLFQFGLYPSYRCHKYVLATVEIALRNPALLQNANKNLYPLAAARCGCTSAALARGIRSAVARAWEMNPALFREISGRNISQPPCAEEFLQMLCRYFRDCLLPETQASSCNVSPEASQKLKTLST